MITPTINRKSLSKIFASMSPADTMWAIKKLTDRLYFLSNYSNSPSSEEKDATWKKELPNKVLEMTVKHRKRVAYETENDYTNAVIDLLEGKYR